VSEYVRDPQERLRTAEAAQASADVNTRRVVAREELIRWAAHHGIWMPEGRVSKNGRIILR